MILDALVVPEHEATMYAVMTHATLSSNTLAAVICIPFFCRLFVFKIRLGTSMYLAQMFCTHPNALAKHLSILQHSSAVGCRTVNKSRCKDVEPELLRAHTAALRQDLSERAREFHGKMQPWLHMLHVVWSVGLL